MAVAYGAFVIVRLLGRKPAAPAKRDGFEMLSAQVPNATVMTEPEDGRSGGAV